MYSISLAAGVTDDRNLLCIRTQSLIKSSFLISGKVFAGEEELETTESIQAVTANVTRVLRLSDMVPQGLGSRSTVGSEGGWTVKGLDHLNHTEQLKSLLQIEGAQVYIQLFRREQAVSPPRGGPYEVPRTTYTALRRRALLDPRKPCQNRRSWRRQILQVTLRISRANSQVPEVASITKWTAFPKITHQETSLSFISPSLLLRLPVYTH